MTNQNSVLPDIAYKAMSYLKGQSNVIKTDILIPPKGDWVNKIASFLMNNDKGITIDNLTKEQLECHFSNDIMKV